MGFRLWVVKEILVEEDLWKIWVEEKFWGLWRDWNEEIVNGDCVGLGWKCGMVE